MHPYKEIEKDQSTWILSSDIQHLLTLIAICLFQTKLKHHILTCTCHLHISVQIWLPDVTK